MIKTDAGNNDYGGQYAKNVYLGETRIVTKLYLKNVPRVDAEEVQQYIYHSDHLGSTSLISDYKGDEYQRIEYTPYGETWIERTDNKGVDYLPYRFTCKELDEETGLYYYGARYLDPKYSMWISTDPALGEYIPEMGKGNAKDSGSLPGMGGIFNHINSNLYHYAGNNPVRFVDPDGRKIRNVAKTMMDWYPNNFVGTSKMTIKSIGCVLTAYYRIAVKMGYNQSIIKANEYAVKANLFTNERFLTRDAGVNMVNGLLNEVNAPERIIFDQEITGTSSEICTKLFELDQSEDEYFVTIRIKYNSGGGHHMNIEGNAVKISGDEFIIFDTYTNWINSSKDSEKRDFTIERVDVFKVQKFYKNWSMIDHESMQ